MEHADQLPDLTAFCDLSFHTSKLESHISAIIEKRRKDLEPLGKTLYAEIHTHFSHAKSLGVKEWIQDYEIPLNNYTVALKGEGKLIALKAYTGRVGWDLEQEFIWKGIEHLPKSRYQAILDDLQIFREKCSSLIIAKIKAQDALKLERLQQELNLLENG